MNKKILITGSCGFLAGNFIRKLIYGQKHKGEKYTIVSVDKVGSDGQNSLFWNKNHIFHPADVCDVQVMNMIFQIEQPEIVIHGAAEPSDGNDYLNNNISGTKVIIDCCVKNHVERLIFLSSDKVYGQLPNEFDLPWDERAPLKPRTLDAVAKASGELLVRALAVSHNLSYNIIRSSNSYGQHQSVDKLIPRTIKCVLENQKIPVYGQGDQIRDWLHVVDNCTAIDLIMNDGANNQIYNVAAHQEFTVIEIVQEVCNAMGTGHSLIDFVENPKLGTSFRYGSNTDKIENLLWKPTYKFKDSISEVVKWYTANSWFLGEKEKLVNLEKCLNHLGLKKI